MNIERVAEQAVVGALLTEPDRYADVREWLEVDDFDGTNERLAYSVIAALHDEGREVSASAVNGRILEVRPRLLPPADGVFLAECMEACPVAERASVYGRMVLESSIRRRVGSEAAGLRQRAEQASTADELNRVFFVVDRVRREVEALHNREAKAHGWATPTPAESIGVGAVRRSPRREDVVVERTAIVALVEQPSALQRVGDWLSADDFDDWKSKVLYAELRQMDRLGEPIDALTIAWRAAETGLADEGVDALANRARVVGPRVDAVHACQAVLERSVRAAVVDTAQVIENRAVERPHMNSIGETHARLNALWPNQRRLVRATKARNVVGHQI